jgi:hypothetical protein
MKKSGKNSHQNTERVTKNVVYIKTPTPDIKEAHDTIGLDVPDPGNSLERLFDQEKADLLRKIRALFRMASQIELDDSYDEDENDLEEELVVAQDIVRHLMRIENCLMWPIFNFP